MSHNTRSRNVTQGPQVWHTVMAFPSIKGPLEGPKDDAIVEGSVRDGGAHGVEMTSWTKATVMKANVKNGAKERSQSVKG